MGVGTGEERYQKKISKPVKMGHMVLFRLGHRNDVLSPRAYVSNSLVGRLLPFRGCETVQHLASTWKA